MHKWYIVILECVWYSDLSFHVVHALTPDSAVRKAKGDFPDSSYVYNIYECGDTKPHDIHYPMKGGR